MLRAAFVQELRLDDPCILFALRRERGPFCREFQPNQTFPGGPCWASFCGPSWLTVLIMETGIGRGNVNNALDWLLAKPAFGRVPYEPSLLIFAGFAGALTADFHIGDIVLADEVVNENGQTWKTTWPPDLPGENWKPVLHRGRLVSVDQLIGEPESKRKVFHVHGAIAVDMESAAFAERCSRAGVPLPACGLYRTM